MATRITDTKYDYEVAIIGAGFSGIGAGIRLKQEGNDSFIIFEKAAEVGGTWRDNTYPGCGCDIPSFLYSFSFEPNPEWTHAFSRQKEILAYIKHCVKKHELEPHLRLNTEIDFLKFHKEEGLWEIRDKSGNTIKARLVISAAGPFNAANIPNIKGKASFEGEAFHSLHWNHDYDLKGKRVAVIGTGASAIQFIPEVAKQVDQLYIFQRTPPYIQPKNDMVYTEKSKSKFRRFPAYQKFWREVIYWFLEYRGRAMFKKNNMREKRTKECIDFLHASVEDPELRKKLTPDYELGCKRVLISDNYYPTLVRDNVELIDQGVHKISEHSVATKDGKTFEVDAIIYGTGFYTTSFPNMFKVIGSDGVNLFEKFNTEGPEGYLGTAIHGYPNFLLMVGPNSGLGHNSIIHMMESQLNYILDYLSLLRKKPNSYFELKNKVQRDFNDDLQVQLKEMVWSEGGCKSYYLQNMDGKNSSIWPGSTMKYRKKTKRVNMNDYEVH